MKCIIFVLASIALAHVQCLTDEQKERLQKSQLLCIAETGVDPKLIAKIRDGDWNVDDFKLKKWSECTMRNSKVLSTDGTVVLLDAFYAKFPIEDLAEGKQLINKCYDKSLPSPELAWSFVKCYQTSNPKQSLF